jgi:hypothetical protein
MVLPFNVLLKALPPSDFRPRARAIARLATSGAKGVHFNPTRGKFEAHITHRYKYYHLGRFDTLEQAVAARREAAERLHGNFARHCDS